MLLFLCLRKYHGHPCELYESLYVFTPFGYACKTKYFHLIIELA